MFIRRKPGKSGDTYVVQENFRDGGQVRHRYVASLGPHPTIPEAIAALDAADRRDEEKIAEIRERMTARKARRRRLAAIGWKLAGQE